MRLLIHSAPSPAEDLALEEAIQLGLEHGASPPTWRLWQAAAPVVVLGTGLEHAKEVDLQAARAAGVAVLRRHSGGGAVLIGPGVLHFSGFHRFAELPGAQTISGAMQAGLKPVLAALARFGVNAECAGLSDIVVRQHGEHADSELRKLAGNAQARKRVSVLVHGTLLADPDWALMERVLLIPARVPEYRQGRGHRVFLTSLKELGAPADLRSFAEALRAVLGGTSDADKPLPEEADKARTLFAEKYSREEWNLRR